MRVISQNGNVDLPYEKTLIFHAMEAVLARCEGYDKEIVLGEYGSNEKAYKVMEMLREQYKALEVLKVLASGTEEHMEKSFKPNEFAEYNRAYRDMNVFQFPQDDEIEV
nr:MAG TPA: hypothetical protein [Caudoviricetes sp.]